jgi:serine/threonine protein phosphatase PrpC
MAQSREGTKLKFCLLTSVGGRKHQEDSVCYGSPHLGWKVIQKDYDVVSSETSIGNWFFIGVADGMGGLEAGDRISKYLCELLQGEVTNLSEFGEKEIKETLKRLQKKLVTDIWEGKVDFEDAGTTLAGLLITPRFYIAFNVGDSRIYKVEGETVEQLSKDHSQAAILMKTHGLTWKEAKRFRNFLYFGFGDVFENSDKVWEHFEPHIVLGELKKGQKFVLCTDGFWDTLVDLGEKECDKENYRCLEEKVLKELSCENLEEVYKRWEEVYKDNVTIGIVEVG